jgi:hypothetical protein
VLQTAILLNEYHFKKTFTFGGFPLCVLPTELHRSERLLKKYMGEYRDLSTDCSIRSDKHGDGEVEGVTRIDGGRARFNWQDRKRHDLKGHPDACTTCSRARLCEGVWQGYLDIWGDGELRSI